MRTKALIITVIIILFLAVVGITYNVSAQTVTPSPTETSLATTPSVSPTIATPTATGSATPTKIASLPKTGMIQYSIAFLAVGAGVILFSLIF